eukprot:scaffold79248_cov27-Phaeocystis_antarctica.AAC.1
MLVSSSRLASRGDDGGGASGGKLESTLPVGALWLGAAARVAVVWVAAAWVGDAMRLPVTPNWMLWPTPGGKRLAPSVTGSPFWFMWVFGCTATFAKSA